MINYVYCPNCGTLMTPYTNFTQCSLCGYRIPAQTVTLTTGTAKAKNVAEGKKACTTNTSVLKASVDAIPVIRCKDCKHYCNNKCDQFSLLLFLLGGEEDDYCSHAERKEE